jgi:hypothetical protein
MWRYSVVIVLGLAGCAIVPGQDAPDPRKYALLVPGQSTDEDAIRLLGPPSASSPLANGKARLEWTDYYRLPKIHLVVPFDANGRLIEVRHVFVD